MQKEKAARSKLPPVDKVKYHVGFIKTFCLSCCYVFNNFNQHLSVCSVSLIICKTVTREL